MTGSKVPLASNVDDSESRRASRESLFLGVNIDLGGRTGDGRIRNISSTGALLETRENFDVGETIVVSFRGVDRASAIVRRRTARGFGIQFEIEIDPYACRLVKSKAGHGEDFILNLREGARRQIWNSKGDIFKRPSTK